jgi:hypothetical protein
VSDVRALMSEYVEDSIRQTRAAERLVAAARHLVPASAVVETVQEIEPWLGPELAAALDSISEAHDAIARAVAALEAKYQVKWAQIVEAGSSDDTGGSG